MTFDNQKIYHNLSIIYFDIFRIELTNVHLEILFKLKLILITQFTIS